MTSLNKSIESSFVTCTICKIEREHMDFAYEKGYVINSIVYIEKRVDLCSKKCFQIYQLLFSEAKKSLQKTIAFKEEEIKERQLRLKKMSENPALN